LPVITGDVAKGMATLRKSIPENDERFRDMAQSALAAGALSALEKGVGSRWHRESHRSWRRC